MNFGYNYAPDGFKISVQNTANHLYQRVLE